MTQGIFTARKGTWEQLKQLHNYNDDRLNIPLEDMSDEYIQCIYKRLQTLKTFDYKGVDNSTERMIVAGDK